MPTLLQHPQWHALDWLAHGFSTRQGGLSTAYEESDLNLGFTPADSRESVLANRELLLQALDTRAGTLTTLSQVHSSTVHATDGSTTLPPGDGLVTATPGVYLAIMTADCVPILLLDDQRRIVAAVHAGWRGTVQRIVEQAVGRMQQDFGSHSEDLSAVIGPSIGACCYSVGEELHQAFTSEFVYGKELFTKESQALHLDLQQANRRQLLSAGLHSNKISQVGSCTSCHPELYFSHRQSHGHTGRMMSVIGLRPGTNSA